MQYSRDAQASTIMEIAPDGDLVLIIGPEETRVRVFSAPLMAASNPFSVMLGPDWKEGHDMRGHDEPFELLLPEDNATPLRIICLIVHGRNEEMPRSLTARTIFAIAVAADKYDCVNTLRFGSEIWLRASGDEPGDLMLLTAAAYVFQNAQGFKEITRALILDYAGSYLDLSSEEIEAVMTWRVFFLLEEKRGFTRLSTAEILIAGVNDGSGLCVHKCGWTSKYAYAYIKLLEEERLWPSHLRHTSISKALETAERMPDPIPKESSTTCTYEYKHAAPAYRRSRSSYVDNLNSKIGLCLYCVRSGSSSCSCSDCSHHS